MNLSADTGSGNGTNRASDLQLLLGLDPRDTESLARLYDRFGRIVFSQAERLLHDARESEEVTQDVFLSAWNNRTNYQPACSSPLTWLTSITRHKCIDRIRKSERRIPCAAECSHANAVREGDAGSDPSAMAARGDLSRQVRECLEKLPESQRIALECSYFDCMTVAEIAEHLVVPRETVRSRIRLAMDKLKNSMSLFQEERSSLL
jgi:RNA polymerase sigma-70 factor (ECF subfamily)